MSTEPDIPIKDEGESHNEALVFIESQLPEEPQVYKGPQVDEAALFQVCYDVQKTALRLLELILKISYITEPQYFQIFIQDQLISRVAGLEGEVTTLQNRYET